MFRNEAIRRASTGAGAAATLAALAGVFVLALNAPAPGGARAPVADLRPTSSLTEPAPAPAPTPTPRPASVPKVKHFASGLVVDRSGPPLQCAVYARRRTGLELYGNASAWWGKAEGRYLRDRTPREGAAMVMGGTPRGHVAVVVAVRAPREIVIDHANWLGGGEIIRGAVAIDVSEAGDWSQVRVGRPPDNEPGARVYPVVGFISEPPAERATVEEEILAP